MAVRRPLIWAPGNGPILMELPQGDTLPGSTMYSSSTEIDFGNTPVTQATFNVADVNALTSNKVMIHQSAEAATGRQADENEMEFLMCRGRVDVNGTIIMYVSAFPGPVSGKYKLHYALL